MKVEFCVVGKTSYDYIKTGMALYEKRLKRYFPFKVAYLPDLKKAKNYSPLQFKEEEGQQILKYVQPEDYLILLDERGATYSSVKFARYLERLLNQSNRRLIFLVGGAYGFSEAVYKRANAQWSLSEMTFSHQMIRLFVLEQLYRGMSILHNEPYHNPD